MLVYIIYTRSSKAVNFTGYSIALQNENYHNAAGPWNITLKDMTIEGSKYGYSPISFYSSKTNTENSKLIFDGVTANLNDCLLYTSDAADDAPRV